MSRDVILTVLIYIFIFVLAVYRIYIGRKILKSETYTFKKQVDPLVFLPKIVEVTLKGKAARFMGNESAAVGTGILIVLLVNGLFAWLDAQILFVVIMFGTVVSDVFASQRGYSLYLENQKDEPD
jgi:hypothetical protein